MSGVDMTPDECAMNGLDPYPEEHDAETIEREWWIRCRYMNGLDVDPADLVGDGWLSKPCGVSWGNWLLHELWTAHEAACLAIGLDPFTSPESVNADAAYMVKHVERYTTGQPSRPPADWVQVLVDAGFDDLPPPMFGLLDDESASRGYLELRELALSRRGSVPQTEPARDESQGKNQEPAKHYPLPDPLNESWREDSAMELIERRMYAISWVIESKEFERMALENGDKTLIKLRCVDEAPKLFEGNTVFEDAWKRGSKRKWWRVKGYDKYMKHRAP